MVCNTIASQPQLFEQYVGTTIDDNLRVMRQLGRWATTCELYAIATCLGRHLYVFSPHPGQGDNAAAYRWLGFPPQEEAVEVVGGHDESVHPRYITLCHTHANHFDRIRPLLAGCNCEMQPPRLAGEEATMDLT
ncbi:hypothetical protein V1264_002469 [Littorina saxatilis]|uniref:Uncharacterized protein n=1 Tax=Littorina saxatilis TaxID=31220 RepID=A0AAN9C4Q3_9CAEN